MRFRTENLTRIKECPAWPVPWAHKAEVHSGDRAAGETPGLRPKGMSRPLAAAPSGAKLTLPNAGRVRRSPPSRWWLLQSRRLLAPDHVARGMRATDYTRTIDFAFQRRRVYRKVAHSTRAASAPVYRGDA